MSSVEEKKHKHGCKIDIRYFRECTCDRPDNDSPEDALYAICGGCGVAEDEGLWDAAWSEVYFDKETSSIEIEHLDSGKKYRLTIEEIKG